MKKQIILTAIVVITLVIVGYIISLFFIDNKVQAEPTSYDICHGTGYGFEKQVTACGDIIKQAQFNYQNTVNLLSGYANSASGAREKIRVLADDFYNKNLSGTNVNFQ